MYASYRIWRERLPAMETAARDALFVRMNGLRRLVTCQDNRAYESLGTHVTELRSVVMPDESCAIAEMRPVLSTEAGYSGATRS